MWYEHCTHCNQDQLFGFRRFVRVENERKGVIGIHWSCPACQGLNRFQTGSAA
jgi:RNase P subunit RPR2